MERSKQELASGHRERTQLAAEVLRVEGGRRDSLPFFARPARLGSGKSKTAKLSMVQKL